MPIHTAIHGSTRVPVVKNGTGFCVVWRDRENKRCRKTFTDLREAKDYAYQRAKSITRESSHVLDATPGDLETLAKATAILAPLRVPLLAAVQEYAAARAQLGDLTLTEAVAAYIRDHGTRAAMPSTSSLVADYLSRAAKRGRSIEHRRHMATDLRRFAAAHPDLRACLPETIEDYLHSLRTTHSANVRGVIRPAGSPISLRFRDNVRDNIRALFRYAQDAGHLPAGTTAPDRVPHLSTGPDIHTYTPDQLARVCEWFHENAREFLPWVVLGAFAGMRSSEVLRLDWSALRWRAGIIAIESTVAKKVSTSRKTPILPPVAEWLRPWQHLTAGQVVPGGKDRPIATARAAMVKAFGWTHWTHNALRHSYASHRLVIRPDAAAVAIEMGTSPAMLRKNYNNPPDPADAAAYFQILPTQPTNIRNIA